MAIIDTVTNYTRLYHDLKRMGRNNFSYEGAKALMEYLDNLSDDMGKNIEYDPIAFCCDFAEYFETEYAALAQEYSNHDNCPQFADYDQDDHDVFADDLFEWLQEQTQVIGFSGGLIIQSF